MDDPTGVPRWYHRHGDKMRVVVANARDRLVVIANGDVAGVRIFRKGSNEGDGYCVNWSIRFSQHEYANGQVVLLPNHLCAAFALPGYDDPVSESSTYRRSGPYLNIPHAGTGHDCDPNVSIFLTDEIRAAVQKLFS